MATGQTPSADEDLISLCCLFMASKMCIPLFHTKKHKIYTAYHIRHKVYDESAVLFLLSHSVIRLHG